MGDLFLLIQFSLPCPHSTCAASKFLLKLSNKLMFIENIAFGEGDINRKGTCLVAWETTCKPKDQGGLGIIDIKSQNNALLLKFLDKFYNKSEVPWVQLTWSKLYANNQTPPYSRSPVGSFWWKEIISLFGNFQTIASCRPNKGDTISF